MPRILFCNAIPQRIIFIFLYKMSFKIIKEYSVYHRKEKTLFIFPDIPYWFVGNNKLKLLLKELSNNFQIENIKKKWGCEVVSLIKDLIDMGIIAKNGMRKNNFVHLTPKDHIWDVHDICEFELTLKCNLRCKHCYISAGTGNKKEISKEDIRAVLKDLKKKYKNKAGKRIVLTGGEPFIRKDIFDILDMIEKIGFGVLINSNGLLINNKTISKLQRYKKLQICISLDGLFKNHEKIRGKGTFIKTIEIIKKLIENNITTSINSLVHQENLKELRDIFNLTKDMKLYGINPVPVVLMGRAKECHIKPVPEKVLFREMYDILKSNKNYTSLLKRTSFVNLVAGLALNIKSHYCGVGSRGTYFISCQGDVYPCPNTRLSSFKLGNVRGKPLLKIIKNNKLLNYLKSLSVDTMNNKCRNCDVRYFCGGYCRGETFYNTGSIVNPYVRCTEYKEGIIESLWVLAENPNFFETKIKEFYENSKRLSN